jgi:hypothetical protein
MHLFIGKSGQIKRRKPGSTITLSIAIPSGVGVMSPFVRPEAELFQGIERMPIVGTYDHNMMWLPRLNQFVMLGIVAHDVAPTLVAGGGTGITGIAIGVFTFAHIVDNVVVHESNPSPITGLVVLANQNRSWSVLPTTHDNPRVNYKRLYVSMDGSDFRWVGDVPLSSATFTEGVLTAELPDADPLLFRRGVPPYAKFVGNYHRRAWYSDGSNTFYFSEIDEPESVPSTNSLKTQDARNVTVFRAQTDQLVVATRKSVQDVQGYSADDYEMRTVSKHIGGISHYASIIVNDKLWIWSQDGYYRYSQGGFQFLMPQLRTYFKKAYLANPDLYEDAMAAIDLDKHVIKVLIPGATSFYYIGHFLPSEIEFGGGGGLPYWTFDRRTRKDVALGVLTNNSLRDELYTGSCDGVVRKENVDDDPDDDGDAYRKQLTIAGKHFYGGDQSGDDQHGHTFHDLTLFVKAEESAWSPRTYAGDDDAYSASAPRWTPERDVPASRQTKGGRTAVAKTSHHFKEIKTAGKGLTVEVVAVAPVRFEYRGLAFEFEQGGMNTRDQAAS